MNYKKIIKILTEQKKTISTMESCTGGGVVNAITNIEGASEVLKYSAVTYSNEFKLKMGVSSDIINTYSVYSIETAKDMSKKICEFTNSNYGIGITGKLNRNDPNNSYGDDNTVHISIFDNDNKTYTTKTIEVHNKNRIENKEKVISEVEKMLTNILNN